jgi:hypothetical protein
MVQTCDKCSRANPAEAVYCYHDGFVLGGNRGLPGRAGPVAVGAQLFPHPFVFPDGRTCRSFNELAIACQEEWEVARDLLQDGHLETFLAGQGRSDLAQAARQAARFPDRDRGLDQLLGKLPGDVLDEPRLRVEPLDINLGALSVGVARTLDLHLENQGMRLLYGSVSCPESVWLALGEPTGGQEKHFQFTHELVLPLHVRGDRLRAGGKPLQARLLVESNGGNVEVCLRAEVPVKPFPRGVLAGARSPRELAQKAIAHPGEAAALVEAGEVQRWYQDNGWTYPVEGPISSGKAGLQQFFEALGLAKPPRVELATPAVALRGNPGERLTGSVEVRTQARRHVYAHARSSQPWLAVEGTELRLGSATVAFAVPAVPDRPGETLRARLDIRSNGNQRFAIPLTLEVGKRAGSVAGELAQKTRDGKPVMPPPLPSATTEGPPPLPVIPGADAPGAPSLRLPGWVHLIPAVALTVALAGVVVWDLAAGRPGQGRPPQNNVWDYVLDDYEPLLEARFHPRLRRFGLVMPHEPDPADETRLKRLTGKEDGQTNNTCVRIDGAEYLFGNNPGRWLGEVSLAKLHSGNRTYFVSRRQITRRERIVVTQHVEIVPGVQSRRLDTCLVWYRIENADTQPHKVGLRVMLDTFIGANDGVPFVVPGRPGLLDKQEEFSQKEVPDYLEAIENPDPDRPGTVAHLGLKGIELPGLELDPITRMVVCRWPGNSELRWEVPREMREPIRKDRKDPGDSCVFLYWDDQNLEPGEVRDLAFTYGLGALSAEGATDLGLTAGGSFKPGDEFTVTAYVKGPKEGQMVKLTLPPGLALAEGEEAEKPVTAGEEYGQVSWRVRGQEVGNYTLHAESGLSKAAYRVRVRRSGIFGAD